MSDQRLHTALNRIAAALDRIERVANQPLPQVPQPQAPLPQADANDASAAELAILQERHAKLKEEAVIALSALDAVIARASAGGRG